VGSGECQCPHAGHTVHELEIAFPFVVYAGVVDDGVAYRFVDPPREVERHLRIVEALGPGILIEYPQYLTRFAQNSADAIEENRLAVGEVVEDESDGPLAWLVGTHEIALVEREVFQRLVSGGFELSDQLHASPLPFVTSHTSLVRQGWWLAGRRSGSGFRRVETGRRHQCPAPLRRSPGRRRRAAAPAGRAPESYDPQATVCEIKLYLCGRIPRKPPQGSSAHADAYC
jgi:hypothetical protein